MRTDHLSSTRDGRVFGCVHKAERLQGPSNKQTSLHRREIFRFTHSDCLDMIMRMSLGADTRLKCLERSAAFGSRETADMAVRILPSTQSQANTPLPATAAPR